MDNALRRQMGQVDFLDAKFPWNLVCLLSLSGFLEAGQGRGALVAVASFASMWVLGMWLGPVIARPRPIQPIFVQVAEKLSGYSFRRFWHET